MGLDSYEIIGVVGTGAFGTVHLCRRKVDKIELVLKNITTQFKDGNELKDFKNEVLILSTLDHPNIIKYYDSFISMQNNAVIVMEFATRGSLNNFVQEQKSQLIDQEVVMSLFCQLCLAVEYLHNRNIIHRDITAHNVLLTGTHKITVKLSDFGVSKYIQRACGSKYLYRISIKNKWIPLEDINGFPEKKMADKGNMKGLSCVNASIGEAMMTSSACDLEAVIRSAGVSVTGTQEYIAPEVCFGQVHTKCSDVWSLGCILYLLITLHLPFIGENLHMLVMKISNSCPDFSQIDRTVYDEKLIAVTSNLLLKDPLQRTNMDQLLSHPFILRYVINVGINYQ